MTSSTDPGSSGSGEPCTVMPRLCSRGLSRVRSWSEMVASVAAHLLDQQEQRVVRRQQVGQPMLAKLRRGDAEELLRRMVDVAETGCPASSSSTGTGSAASIAAASGARRCAGGRGRTATTGAAALMPPPPRGSSRLAARVTPRAISGS